MIRIQPIAVRVRRKGKLNQSVLITYITDRRSKIQKKLLCIDSQPDLARDLVRLHRRLLSLYLFGVPQMKRAQDY